MNPAYLWAKSKRPDEAELASIRLSGHLADVLEAATRLLDATADEQLRALGLDPERYRERLRRCVRLAAALHDLGKANDHFQGMIRGVRDVRQNPQGLRHEWVSVLILKELRDWLLAAVDQSELDLAIVEWAISGHHPSWGHESPPRSCPAGAGPEIVILNGHPDVRAILDWLRETFGLARPPELSTATRLLAGADKVYVELAFWAKGARRVWDAMPRGEPDSRFVAAVKGCLIAADVAGSALPKSAPDDPARWDWITRSFANVPEVGDIRKVAQHRLNGEVPRKFQQDVASSRSFVTYVKAGCGTGKTVAAYLWAAANHPTRRLYFCYPTTGTATEGFKDYLFEPDGELGGLGARLFHSRRDVDFEIILGTGADSQNPEADVAARLESLESWSTPIVACTVDTVLGLVQNNKRGLFAWPALAQAAFVFDEIHAYDDRLFGALLRFLRDLPGLPCLLMTASLPKPREAALLRTIRAVHGFDLEAVPGPKELEQLPRYQKRTAPGNDPLPLIEGEIRAGGKVLWVCNTVGRVMDAAVRAKDFGPLIYHSRFRYEDRVERHRRVVEAFTPEHQGPALAICSQVAEMSLDLKGCTLLVTDLAPVPPLIQRLGRLNRQANPGDPTRPFVVLELDTDSRGWHLPYTPAELDAARAWLGRLPEADISQEHLAECWEQTADNPPQLVESAWLDGGPTTTVIELREASPGITVLMEADRPRVKRSPKTLARLLLPMPPPPRLLGWQLWAKERGIAVAPSGAIEYDPERGAAWRA
jgi:CRISPR-associated endonuclease/helicase Cas3